MDSMQVISRELIGPSSPTPDHLKTLKLSLIDQLSAPVYISLLFFYETDELKGSTGSTNHAQICQNLKQSLSNILTTYYPLAGKIDSDNYTINCNDDGVEFIEARAQERLKDVIEDPQLESFQKYLPVDPLRGIYRGEGTLFMVQVNFFNCGGLAIGACASHAVVDGAALVKFMNAWAATCRGQSPESAPNFGAMGRYLPARDISEWNVSPSLLLANDKLVTKRFIFDEEKLSALKRRTTHGRRLHNTDYYVKDPTRVEVVSAFIWKHFIEQKLLDAKKSFVGHLVNIRSRAGPSLELENTFGNGCFMTTAWTPQHDDSHVPELDELVNELRRAIRTIDDGYIREARDEDRYLWDLGKLCDAVLEGEGEGFLFSSWFRFPIYEVDFGWGRPVWVGTTALLLNNLAIFMSTRTGDGIEVWINLLPENVQAFKNGFELITAEKS